MTTLFLLGLGFSFVFVLWLLMAAEDIPSTGSFGHGDIPVKTM